MSKLFQGKGKSFPGETLQGMGQKFSRENVSREGATVFLGRFFQGNGGMRLPFSCAGVVECGPVSYPGPPRGPDEAAFRLERQEPCRIKRSFLASTGACAWGRVPTCDSELALCESHGVQAARRAGWLLGRPEWGAACEGVGGSRGRCRPAGPSSQ